MQAVAIIPARWGSTRFEGKVLAPIAGKPMIQHVFERVQKSSLINQIIIACDDKKIVSAAQSFGADARLTAREHPSGTDRIAEVARGIEAQIIVNVQGDEPLIDPSIIDELVKTLKDDQECLMATVIRPIIHKEDIGNPNVVKVVCDRDNYALYFSRAAIPFDREQKGEIEHFQHLGIYAYRKAFLLDYVNLPSSDLEVAERLEQLRALQAGIKIKVTKTDIKTIGVDTKEDLKKVEAYLTKK